MLWISLIGGLFALVVLWLNVMATVGLLRSKVIPLPQRLGQLAFVWIVPLLGAWLVVYLMSEHDDPGLPTRWVPDEEINAYVLDALHIQARGINKATERVIEAEVLSAVSEDMPAQGSDGHE